MTSPRSLNNGRGRVSTQGARRIIVLVPAPRKRAVMCRVPNAPRKRVKVRARAHAAVHEGRMSKWTGYLVEIIFG